jgi:hypothetical protein
LRESGRTVRRAMMRDELEAYSEASEWRGTIDNLPPKAS